MSLERITVVQALKCRHVIRGHVCKGEPIDNLTKETSSHIDAFLLEWKEDAVVGIALSFGRLETKTILSLINAGVVRREELEDAFKSLLECIADMGNDLKHEPFWISLKEKARELSRSKDEDGWYVFTKIERLLRRSKYA